jgi:5'-deoxynucleotidase YfbR-like HD superfamily hydrolase
MISPFKAAVGLDYKAFERRLLAAINLRFGLPAIVPQWVERLIKRADKTAAFLEATQLAGFSITEAHKFFGRPKGLSGEGGMGLRALKPLAPNDASAQYLRKFRQLQ